MTVTAKKTQKVAAIWKWERNKKSPYMRRSADCLDPSHIMRLHRMRTRLH